MEKTKKCPECGKSFLSDHGNDVYCSVDCYDEAKRKREKEIRDAVKTLYRILKHNNERIDFVQSNGISILTRSELDSYAIDISLCRYLQPPPEHLGKQMLDFGLYYLITEPDFLTFKIYKHETSNAIQSK